MLITTHRLSTNFGIAFKKVTELGLRKGGRLLRPPSSKSFEEGGGSLLETLNFRSSLEPQVLTTTLTSQYGGDFVATFRGIDSGLLTVSPEMGQLIKGKPTELTVTFKGGSASTDLRLLVETEQEDFQFIILVKAEEGS